MPGLLSETRPSDTCEEGGYYSRDGCGGSVCVVNGCDGGGKIGGDVGVW